MAKLNIIHKVFIDKKIRNFLVLATAILLILLAGFLLYYLLVSGEANNYRIKNKYYGFELKTPKGWFAESKAVYSEDNIEQLLVDCKNAGQGENSVYEIGRFRFESQKYPQGFGDMGYFPAGFPSGAILDITVNCIPGNMKDKIISYNYSNLEIAGEKAFSEILNMLGFERAKYLSFFHNNLQYKVHELVYISPSEKGNLEEIKENFVRMFSGIISSFKFVK